MYKLSNESLSSFIEWQSPTFQDVTYISEKIGLTDQNIENLLGVNSRTLRRWTSKKNINRLEKSSIPYAVWCVFIALSENKIIFSDIKTINISQVPGNYLCSFDEFTSPPKEVLTLFVGKNSITGLHRTELASLFGWNSTYMGRVFNNGDITYLNWVLLLLFCGVDIHSFINVEHDH